LFLVLFFLFCFLLRTKKNIARSSLSLVSKHMNTHAFTHSHTPNTHASLTHIHRTHTRSLTLIHRTHTRSLTHIHHTEATQGWRKEEGRLLPPPATYRLVVVQRD
jgi:hypothetical protein